MAYMSIVDKRLSAPLKAVFRLVLNDVKRNEVKKLSYEANGLY